jgi:branched-chain amino acid aminotransferase
LNGEFRKTGEPCLFPQNRAFRFGDVLHENLHAFATELQFPEYHLERLSGNMRLLSMEMPAYFTAGTFRQLTSQLLNKNRIFGGAGIRLSVFRDTLHENFIPEGERISFILESQRLEYDKYVLNERGQTVDLCTGYLKSAGALSAVREAHALHYLLAGMEGRKRNLDSVLMLNETGRLVETQDSNIFLVSGNAIFTPGISQGCIPGIMQRVILELAGNAGYRINDQSSLTPAALDDAEELFFTNAVDGIRWVVAFRDRRYYKRAAKMLNEKLNEKAFG